MQMSEKKRVVVALDTGFEGGKINVNGHLYNIPFMIQDITDLPNSYKMRRMDENFIRCKKDGREYLLGSIAREYVLNARRRDEKQAVLESFYTMERYNMKIFEVALTAFIGYGLYRYAVDSAADPAEETFELVNLADYEINVGIALPHKYLADLTEVVEGYLIKPQEIELIVGTTKVNYGFNIKRTFYNSQVICALINEAVTDEFEDVMENSIYDNLPALIMDSGYKTHGEFEFDRTQSISGDSSKYEYAMMEVNRRVADKISMYKPGYHDYMIDDLVEKHEKVNYIDSSSGKVQSIDVEVLKQEALAMVAAELIDHLNKTYGDLLDIKVILVAGGTGKAFYPYIKDYCEKNRPHINVMLAGSQGFMGKPLEPVYAIVCGLYKDIMMQLLDADEAV